MNDAASDITTVEISKSIARAETEFSRILDWIGAADSRLRFVLPVAITMLGVLSASASSSKDWTLLGATSVVLASFFLILCIVFCSFSSFPRTSGRSKSLIYFGSISSRTTATYVTEFSQMTDEDYLSDLLHQCHRTAQIVQTKFKWLQKSIACVFISLIPWVVSLYEFYSHTQ